ncbi:hypothetical protein [uncultured Ilumatobacter sp.]|uniref:hypothetical protein n=1 Tax=uncultured Ilumatobacter sp. TaxID=879968 RepID=UPI00374FD7FD
MNSRHVVRLLCGAGSVVVLASCFTSTANFKSAAESFIAEQVSEQIETTLTNVNCVAPINRDIGTRFTCQAVDEAGAVWEFDNVIEAEGKFTVNISRRP